LTDIRLIQRLIGEMKMETDKEIVQVVAIAGMTALGIAALVVDGSMGETIMVAVAGAIGVIAGYLFPKGGSKDEVQ